MSIKSLVLVFFTCGIVFPAIAFSQSSRYGEAFIQADDFSGDGIPDLIVTDPGDVGGIGSLYVFYGPVNSNPLPPASQADAVIAFDVTGLLDTGWRIKQGCDFTFDGIPDLYIGSSIAWDNGTIDDRLLVVDPVSWRVIADFRGGPDVPDYWNQLDGSECEYGDWIDTVLTDWGYDLQGDGGDDSSSSPPNSDGFGTFNIPEYLAVLFDINPFKYAKNTRNFVVISICARETARKAYPVHDNMPKSRKSVQQWNRNAMRHALWQGLLTHYFGVNKAKEIGDIHEQGSDDPLDTWIDLYNNQVARNIAEQCFQELGAACTIEELLRRLLQALDDDRFIKSPCDPRVPAELKPTGCVDTGDPIVIGDVNSDGTINMNDLVRTATEFGTRFMTADLNTNGVVDADDLAQIAIIVENQP